jgi:hypothetical protein
MKVKEIAITVAVAVLFSALILVAVDAFYSMPEYSSYCDNSIRPLTTRCLTDTTKEEMDCYDSGGTPTYTYNESGCQVYESCSQCNNNYNSAVDSYRFNLFLILGIIGLAAIIFGVYYNIEFIGSGFMFSGIFLLLYATAQGFSTFTKYVRVFVVLLELCIVLWIAFKKVLPKETAHKKGRAGN